MSIFYIFVWSRKSAIFKPYPNHCSGISIYLQCEMVEIGIHDRTKQVENDSYLVKLKKSMKLK